MADVERRDRSLRGRLRRLGHEMIGREPRSKWHHLWRDLVPLLALILATIAVASSEGKADRAEVTAARASDAAAGQVEGRRVAISVLCGFGNGVEQAGKAALTAPVGPPEFRRSLERLGLPPARVREKQREASAQLYARSISEAVVEQAGVESRKVIRADGSMDCEALQKVARANP